ncbi:uncharacterized protein A1O5_07964 [Cladophialophora psammophila CBS 110553]|uniref:T6SS Phospholipase effector Tle1-like catalytic domain-containing protein n=1 Tax=Cladophialophora psammophila CBS 110553 TaxID=1182543 RepID=W9XF72_9EURO|nr:uncharacterized protein A1O5_07964 [Cladophialophora psammophila CBS 110553]EXJ69029.1 hypothetical protein A1O5_07964 [Cladophialophora psammophila CBS 110553]
MAAAPHPGGAPGPGPPQPIVLPHGAAPAAPAPSRRHLIFCDGTGENAADVGPSSNLARLALSIGAQGLDGKQQICYYQQGLGTGTNNIKGIANRIFELGLGQAPQRSVPASPPPPPRYQPGDTLCFFGFSRGAATARAAADFIATVGLLQGPADPKLVSALYGEWLKVSSDNYKPPTAPELRTTRAEIECVGVFDTVQGLGVPKPVQESLRSGVPPTVNPLARKAHLLHKSIPYGFQALALHEMRDAFTPEVWSSKSAPAQRLQQTWFAGKHSDVGGAIVEGKPNSGLANVALRWMAALLTNIHIGIAVKNADLNKNLEILLGEAGQGQARIQGTTSATLTGGQTPRTPGRYAKGIEEVHVSVRNTGLLNIESMPSEPALEQLIGVAEHGPNGNFVWVNKTAPSTRVNAQADAPPEEIIMEEDPTIAPQEGSAGNQTQTAPVHPLPSSSNPAGSVPRPIRR